MSTDSCRGLRHFRDRRARVPIALLTAALAVAGASREASAAIALVKNVGTNSNETSGTTLTVATPDGHT